MYYLITNSLFVIFLSHMLVEQTVPGFAINCTLQLLCAVLCWTVCSPFDWACLSPSCFFFVPWTGFMWRSIHWYLLLWTALYSFYMKRRAILSYLFFMVSLLTHMRVQTLQSLEKLMNGRRYSYWYGLFSVRNKTKWNVENLCSFNTRIRVTMTEWLSKHYHTLLFTQVMVPWTVFISVYAYSTNFIL